MKILRLPLTSSSFLELKEKFGTPGRARGQKRPLDEEAVKDNDGLVKRHKPQVCFHMISTWCTCGWLYPQTLCHCFVSYDYEKLREL